MSAATARIGQAKADRFPKLSITGILGVASPQLSRLVTNESYFGVVGPSMAAPTLRMRKFWVFNRRRRKPKQGRLSRNTSKRFLSPSEKWKTRWWL